MHSCLMEYWTIEFRSAFQVIEETRLSSTLHLSKFYEMRTSRMNER